MELQREGIIIDCSLRNHRRNIGWVPNVKTNLERYQDYKMKALGLSNEIEPSNFSWNFKDPKKSVLRKPAKKVARRTKK